MNPVTPKEKLFYAENPQPSGKQSPRADDQQGPQPRESKNLHRDESDIRLFARYVFPNVMGMIGLSCYILADTFFVANGVGSAGLTALNLVLPIYSFINGIALMLGMGGATAFSIHRGEGVEEHARRVFSQSLFLAICAGLLLTVAGGFFAFDLATLLGADDSILPLAGVYLKTLMLFSCAFILNSIVLCYVRNDGDPRLAMCAMLVGSASNVVLDYVFIFPMGMGMFGAAFATGLAPLISLSILSLHWIRKKSTLKLSSIMPELHNVKRILSLGFPSFITESSSGIIMLFFNFTILNLAGNTGVAAYGIIANLALIVTAVFTGIAQGAQPLLSHGFGEKRTEFVRSIFRMALFLAVTLGVLSLLSGLLFSDQIVSIFNRDGNEILARTAKSGILLYFPAFLIAGVNIVSASYFSSVSRPLPSFLISILRGYVAVIPAILILPRFLGMAGVWLSIPLAELLTLAAASVIQRRIGHR